MTNSFPKNPGTVGKSGTPADQIVLIQDHDAATNEGRQVLALEMIADQLGIIARHLGSGQVESDPLVPKLSRLEDRPDTRKAEEMPGGIERTWVESYAVGGYNYTNLELAIEEAKRARKRPAASTARAAHS